MNALEILIFSEDVGAIDVVITLSGPRIWNTTVQLSISNNDATGILQY